MVASAGEDNQVALWDLAVERDDDEVVEDELKVFYVIFFFAVYARGYAMAAISSPHWSHLYSYDFTKIGSLRQCRILRG